MSVYTDTGTAVTDISYTDNTQSGVQCARLLNDHVRASIIVISYLPRDHMYRID